MHIKSSQSLHRGDAIACSLDLVVLAPVSPDPVGHSLSLSSALHQLWSQYVPAVMFFFSKNIDVLLERLV